ncbi:AGE family epimerase/isomerase [Ancylobacter mangrovi]|uniref:AGE family epimerase/isomerase n=1 Tax=Ancylobacter mangrovi TaxID=2972472 RepID=UPI002162ED03|nr:AGE family epimerase/isomerase [Ancylobacter mangrovi]MCS0502756.1 AGE family epimerase/isomerase [Ancylobacter mangrovi]
MTARPVLSPLYQPGQPPAPIRRDAGAWAAWFRRELMPWWAWRAADPDFGGFFDRLLTDGNVPAGEAKTCLAQARTLFTLSHLALGGDEPALVAGAHAAYRFLRDHILDPATGGYVRAVARDGRPTGVASDRVSRSYDHSFVVLALATYGRLAPSAAAATEIVAALEDCWSFIETRLVDRASGLLLEDDGVADPAAPDAPLRAQNPHMHMFEAALQAFEMTGEARWLARADGLLAVALKHFLDADTGTIMEFRAPDLSPAPGTAGPWREIGHQCEWAWLLHRYERLGGTAPVRAAAGRMMDFALAFGFCPEGPMRGAAYDGVAADGSLMAGTFLLWPQTEAAKAFVARFELGGEAGDAAEDARRAREIAVLVFERYFAGRTVWCNQLDAQGRVLQPEALSRLLYHVAMLVTEGERLGLWPGPRHA